MQDHTAPRILVIGPAWIGDMVMTQSLFKLLRQQYPQCTIDVAAPGWTLPVLERTPEVREALALPFKHGEFAFWKRLRLGKSWRQRGYDWAILIPNSWKSALLPAAAGIARRTGWVGEQRYGLLNDIRSLDKKKLSLMVERFMALAMPAGKDIPKPYLYPELVVDQSQVKQLCAKHGIDLGALRQPILALCPGAEYGSSKRWPAEYYAQLAQQKLADGWQVVLFGSPKERAQAEIVLQQAPACIDLVGKTKLGEAIDVLSAADWVVCNDSGLMHIASALGRRVIAFYGATPADLAPPLTDQAYRLEVNHLPCRPCFKRECPLQHHKCMRDILPQQVLQILHSEAAPT